MDASYWPYIIAAGASGLGAYASSRSKNKDRALEEQLSAERIAAQADINRQDVALKESLANPFRNQLDQAGSIGALDRMERSTYTPFKLSGAPPRYAGSIPEMSGGYSYEKSPELISSAAALKRNVMGANTAPTMTNPANYGKSAALDLVRIGADGVDPATVNASASRGPGAGGTATGQPTDYLANVPRRGGGTGGVASGALKGASMGSMVPGAGTIAGAGIGAIVGAATKHAKTAPNDVDVQTAVQVLTQVIQQQQGRSPNPGEIEQMLAGQGLKPGDRWVGELGLRSLINTLMAQSSGMQPPSYTGHG
jgi:hypothetical protein